MSDHSPAQYCFAHVRQHRPDAFLAALYVPPPARAVLIILHALDIEFAHIKDAAKEELIAHMRYAWWEEALEKTFAGNPPAGHPVLEAAAGLADGKTLLAGPALELLHAHRSHYPENLGDEALEEWVHSLLQAAGPKAQAGWNKANDIIARHRQRHGMGKNSLLHLKLLVKGWF